MEKKTRIKEELHTRNKHREGYNFELLSEKSSDLKQYIITNKFGLQSIDFSNNKAVVELNRALLKTYYKIKKWGIPEGYLCPPIPGRADYIHNIADLLAGSNDGSAPLGTKIKMLDIGVGSNCIYPIIARNEYYWSVIGSEIDKTALQNCIEIVQANDTLKSEVKILKQSNPKNILYNILSKDVPVDVTICNPPFHASQEEADKANFRKNRKLKIAKDVNLNFGGQNAELWCKGGEKKFIRDYVRQSEQFKDSCLWFTSLISKESSISSAKEALKKSKVNDFKIIEMGQGQKKSRIIAWTYKTEKERKQWAKNNWQDI